MTTAAASSIPATPANETRRLDALHALELLDTLPEQAYDDITLLASAIADTPISLISLVDEGRQWFKSKVGLDVSETPREHAFCAHAIVEPTEVLVVPDATKDGRFATNPLVTSDPDIRFYAGAPLVTADGDALGTLCVIDREPRQFDGERLEALRALSRQVVAQFELRRALMDLSESARQQARYERQLELYQAELERMNASLRKESRTDCLTGLVNRRGFERRCAAEVDRAAGDGQPMSLIMLDIDAFKAFNDDFGHQGGDTCLAALAGIIEDTIRKGDIAARYGGEEFAIILPDTSAEAAFVVAERCRRAVSRADWAGRGVTISLGVATSGGGWSVERLVKAADEALYEAKRQGRDRVIAAIAPDAGDHARPTADLAVRAFNDAAPVGTPVA